MRIPASQVHIYASCTYFVIDTTTDSPQINYTQKNITFHQIDLSTCIVQIVGN